MTTRRTIGTAAAALALLLPLAACGDDDGEAVREVGAEAGSSSGSGSGSASGVTAEEADCEPVGEELEDEATATVEIELVDHAIEPGVLEVEPGVTTFVTENEGEEAHELAFLPGGGPVPLLADGSPDEGALAEAGAFELEAYGPGQTCSITVDLEPGEYTLFCVVEGEDGRTHLSKGMVAQLTVG